MPAQFMGRIVDGEQPWAGVAIADPAGAQLTLFKPSDGDSGRS
ncbi:MAG TPA: hypothetical protein VIL37_04415 [Natronosporangium sp.]